MMRISKEDKADFDNIVCIVKEDDLNKLTEAVGSLGESQRESLFEYISKEDTQIQDAVYIAYLRARIQRFN